MEYFNCSKVLFKPKNFSTLMSNKQPPKLSYLSDNNDNVKTESSSKQKINKLDPLSNIANRMVKKKEK